jgi:hypothetical protein
MAFSSEVEAGSRKENASNKIGDSLSNSPVNMVEVG